MKKVILTSIAMLALSITSMQAQENKTVKEESVVKRVVTKEGSNVTVKEVKKTDTESGAVIVEGNDETNQEFNETMKKSDDVKVLMDETNLDEKNVELVDAAKKNQASSLKESIQTQNEKAAMEAQKERQAKLKKQQEELDARRAALMKRPEGMSKLKKD